MPYFAQARASECFWKAPLSMATRQTRFSQVERVQQHFLSTNNLLKTGCGDRA